MQQIIYFCLIILILSYTSSLSVYFDVLYNDRVCEVEILKKIVLIIMMIIFIMSGCNQEVEQEQEEIRTSVEVSEVKLDSINLVTTFTGRVQSEKTIPVLTQTPGEVDEIYVSNNQYVKKGDKLFSLVSTNNLRQLQQAQASYDSAYANYLQTEDQLNLAIENYERTKKLFEAGAVSE